MAADENEGIEDVQAALREGIERAQEMVHDYERLFRGPPPALDNVSGAPEPAPQPRPAAPTAG